MSEDETFEDESNDVAPAAISLPGIEIALEESASQPVTASKLGGVPYLAPDAEQPRDEDGEPLTFLLQIRCEDLPPNDFLPESGLLQFWHGSDDLMGADLDDPLESAAAVLHIEDPDESVTAEDVLKRLADGDDYTPLPWGSRVEGGEAPEREFALRFSLATSTDPNNAAGHRLGGHAAFVQEDPRPWGTSCVPTRSSCSSWTRTSPASAGGTWASGTSSSPRSRRRLGTTPTCSTRGTAADPSLTPIATTARRP